MRVWIARGCIIVSIGVTLAGIRLYPFSDYPLYAGARTSLWTDGLACADRDGHQYLLRPRALYPLSRLHMSQRISQTKNLKAPDWSWVQSLTARVAEVHPNCARLSVFSFEFAPPNNADDDADDELKVNWSTARKLWSTEL